MNANRTANGKVTWVCIHVEDQIWNCWAEKVSQRLFSFQFCGQNGLALSEGWQEMLEIDPLKYAIMVQQVEKRESW